MLCSSCNLLMLCGVSALTWGPVVEVRTLVFPGVQVLDDPLTYGGDIGAFVCRHQSQMFLCHVRCHGSRRGGGCSGHHVCDAEQTRRPEPVPRCSPAQR